MGADILDLHLEVLNPIYWAFVSVIYGGMCLSILYMRKRHPHEIYVIWLVASFFFTIFSGAGIYAHHHDIGITSICGSYRDSCSQAIQMLMNFEDELRLVTIFIAITIIPQVLAYLLGALS